MSTHTHSGQPVAAELAELLAQRDRVGVAAESAVLAEPAGADGSADTARSARLVEAVMRFTSDAVIVTDRLGETVVASPSLCRMLGTTRTPRGREVWNRVHPDDLPALLAAAEAADAHGVTGTPHLFRLRRDDGEWRWMEGIGADARADEAIRGFVITLRDVTERPRALDALDRRVRQQAAVSRLGQRALTGEGLDELLSDALTAVAAGLDTPDVFSFEVVSGGDTARLVAGLGRHGEHRGLKMPLADLPMCACAVTGQQPVVIEDIEAESRVPTATLRA